MGASILALLQPLSLDCGLGGKQKSHRLYSLSQVQAAGEFASYFWHIYSSPHSCCHLTALHISQSEGLTRLPKWSLTIVWLEEENSSNEGNEKFSTLDQNILPKLIQHFSTLWNGLWTSTLWSWQQLLMLLLWGKRLPVSCRGAVALCQGLFWTAGRKNGEGRYGHGDWWKSGTKPGRISGGQLGLTKGREKNFGKMPTMKS